MNLPVIAQGSCHCEAVRFSVTLRQWAALECNCSICQMLGYQHIIVQRDDFELLSGDRNLTSYRFNTGVAEHLFCDVCGVKAFYRPRSHPDGISVNLRCLSANLRKRFELSVFDGLAWEANIGDIRE